MVIAMAEVAVGRIDTRTLLKVRVAKIFNSIKLLKYYGTNKSPKQKRMKNFSFAYASKNLLYNTAHIKIDNHKFITNRYINFFYQRKQ